MKALMILVFFALSLPAPARAEDIKEEYLRVLITFEKERPIEDWAGEVSKAIGVDLMHYKDRKELQDFRAFGLELFAKEVLKSTEYLTEEEMRALIKGYQDPEFQAFAIANAKLNLNLMNSTLESSDERKTAFQQMLLNSQEGNL